MVFMFYIVNHELKLLKNMFPSVSTVNHEAVNTSKRSFKNTEDLKDSESKDFDCFIDDNDIILEEEEEYDILNNETFGVDESYNLNTNIESDSSNILWEENYDLHNNETFGEDIEYDWETEHQKFVNFIENKAENSESDDENSNAISKEKSSCILIQDVEKRNGYRQIDSNNYCLSKDNNTIDKLKSTTRFSLTNHKNSYTINGAFENHDINLYDDTYEDLDENIEFGCTNTLTKKNCNKIPIYNKEINKESESLLNCELLKYSQNYSLFSSGTNLLQNAGINIPNVTSKPMVYDSIENLNKKLDSVTLESSLSSIPNVSDLEKKWINDVSSQPSIINADCFRAYNSAFYVNSNTASNKTNNHFILSSQNNTSDAFETNPSRNVESNSIVLNLSKLTYPTAAQNLNYSIDETSLRYDRKLYPNEIYFKTNDLIQYNNSPIGTPHFAVVDTSMTNSNIPGLIRNEIKVFPPPPPPPPGLTLDPAKMCHVQSATVLQSHQQPATYLTLPPPQVFSELVSMEQQKQLNKMQREGNLSDIDEYAGMMTEREKYWLAGVQLLQINSMDPYKDDYYFTNYQARRKGNRNKNQNLNNSSWKNAYTKDYLPLQFENSLGKVQIGSVVAPRKVIDTDLIDNSPKQNKLEIVPEDLIVNTSSRKRKAIMLQIENMYGKIMALETLQLNNSKSKSDPISVKTEFENIVTGLKEEILNLKDDFKIIMSIKKGKRLILRFLSFCDNPDDVWFQIFEILDRITRVDQEHYVLLSYLPYFRVWLTTADLNKLIRIGNYFKRNLNLYLQDKFSVSVMANMIDQADLIFYHSEPEYQNLWMNFVKSLAEIAHSSFENIEKPVVSVKPQILRNHLSKLEKLENGYTSYLLKIFSNNSRK